MTARSAAIIVAGLAALAGCARGPIHGWLTLPGQPSKAVAMRYESSLFGKTGRLFVEFPDGETFSGPYLLDPNAPDRAMLSTLAGDRGNNLQCRFLLNAPGIGPDGGGQVRCQVSSGGAFEASF